LEWKVWSFLCINTPSTCSSKSLHNSSFLLFGLRFGDERCNSFKNKSPHFGTVMRDFSLFGLRSGDERYNSTLNHLILVLVMRNFSFLFRTTFWW